jgi:hypothetical protein
VTVPISELAKIVVRTCRIVLCFLLPLPGSALIDGEPPPKGLTGVDGAMSSSVFTL